MRSDAFESIFLRRLDVEDFVETGDFKDFVDFGADTAETQLGFCRLDLLVHRDQLAESRAGQVLDDTEVEDDLLATVFIDEGEELVSDVLNIRFVEDFFIDELGDGNSADLFDIQPPLSTRHVILPLRGASSPLKCF